MAKLFPHWFGRPRLSDAILDKLHFFIKSYPPSHKASADSAKGIKKFIPLLAGWRLHWVVLGLTVLFVSSFSLVYFIYDHTLAVNAESSNAVLTGDSALANTTFLKSYRLLVFTKINGTWPTKDGGYIVSGITDPNIMFIPPDGFVAKLNKQGDVEWMKFLKTKNARGEGNVLGEEDVQSIIELKDGGYLMASKVWGFITAKEWTLDNVELNKILFTRLDKNGKALWSKSFTAAVEDARNSLLETSDKGFLFYAPVLDLLPNERGEDSDVYQDLPFASLKVFKFDKNGNLKWSKNLENFISRENDTYLVTTPDGGYALAGTVAEANAEKAPPYNYDAFPGLVKFDKDFNVQWAKSMEGIPVEMAAVIMNPGGAPTLGWKQYRQGACAIQGLIRTPDNGYLAVGNLSGGLSLITDSNDLKSNPKNSWIGFKFDSAGNLTWVKKLTLSFNEFTLPMTEFSLAMTADNKIMMAGPFTWTDPDFREKTQRANAARDAYCVKYGISEVMCKANAIFNTEDSEETKKDWEEVHALYTIVQDSSRPGVFMMKTDADLNINWSKIFNPQRGVTNYVVKPTADSGAIIGGEYVTNVIQSVILDSITYYKDGWLAKVDASGNVKNEADWQVDYADKIVTEMVTPYAISNDLTVRAQSYSTKITKRVPEFSVYKKTKTLTYAAFDSSKETLPALTPPVQAHAYPLQNSVSPSTAKRTWPEINFERAIPAELVNDKSRTINGELLPILNQLYNSRVKMTDNMDGAMLYYVFDRIITSDDLTAMKDHFEGLGYKTQDQGQYDLTTYKPGYFLILTFATNNANKAFLKVTF